MLKRPITVNKWQKTQTFKLFDTATDFPLIKAACTHWFNSAHKLSLYLVKMIPSYNVCIFNKKKTHTKNSQEIKCSQGCHQDNYMTKYNERAQEKYQRDENHTDEPIRIREGECTMNRCDITSITVISLFFFFAYHTSASLRFYISDLHHHQAMMPHFWEIELSKLNNSCQSER